MRKMRIPQIFTLIRDLHPLANTHAEHTNKGDKQFSLLVAFCRNEATRTPDPYVPNVVRYQLRYIPNAIFLICGCKDMYILGTSQINK